MQSVDTHRKPHRGFTLVELLTVIAILGILLTLVTTTTLRVWSRGQITSCTNKQYQIAFALLRYDDLNRRIPGWLNDNPHGAPGASSWPVELLPFLGRSDIYDAWPPQFPCEPDGPGKSSVKNLTIDIFICPSNRPRKDPGYPVIHYAANTGVDGMDKDDGVFLYRYTKNKNLLPQPAISLDDIIDADGSGTTLAFSEKPGRWVNKPHTWIYPYENPCCTNHEGGRWLPCWHGCWHGDPKDLYGFWLRSWPPPFPTERFPPVFGVPPTFTRPVPAVTYQAVLNLTATARFAPSSNHAGGVVVAYCDGHTGFLKDDLKPYEYGQLLTPKSRWQGTTNKTNSQEMQPWLLKGGLPYLLDESILKR